MSLKKAAEELLKVAEAIETEAAEVTQFVCDSCNHTANLATINAKRKTAAEEVGGDVVVATITVNDTIACPACEGAMSYKASETSEKFYFDPSKEACDDAEKADNKEETKEAAPDEETTEEEVPVKKEASAIDYDSLERYTR